ncbi:uncharacterized protein LOC132702513 [Cylas formicarius]|uniref:uncharacterized protein LOC132702513 n=1 Tax=Cylas formicarius TaxID=197179 RepID=UPI002958C9F5|nr:uncharacterized protein LOC132702513 [Cylas formicarius]
MKVYVAIFTSLLAFQATQSASVTPFDIGDVVRPLFSAFVNGLSEFEQNAQKQNQEILANITAATENILEQKIKIADQIFDGVTDVLNSFLSGVSENANDAGKVIIQCVEAEKEDAHQVLVDTVTDITSCENQNLKTLADAQAAVLQPLGVLVDKLIPINDDLQQCIFGDLCLLSFLQSLSELGDDANQLGDALKSLIATVVEFAQEAAVCAQNEDDTLQQRVEDVFNNAAACIQNSFSSNNQQPTTDQPASEAPASEAPASETPASEAPASEAPASEAPASEAPPSPTTQQS